MSANLGDQTDPLRSTNPTPGSLGPPRSPGRQEWGEGAPEGEPQAGLNTPEITLLICGPNSPPPPSSSRTAAPQGATQPKKQHSPGSLAPERLCRPASRQASSSRHLSPRRGPLSYEDVGQALCRLRERGFSADPGRWLCWSCRNLPDAPSRCGENQVPDSEMCN